jgi:hypothetical protein
MNKRTFISLCKALSISASAMLLALVLVSGPMLEIWHQQIEKVAVAVEDGENNANEDAQGFTLQAPDMVAQSSAAKVPQSMDGDILLPAPPAHLQVDFVEKALFIPLHRFSRVLFRHILSTNAP